MIFDLKDMPAHYATYILVVYLDPNLGYVGLLEHIIVDDCGGIINPLLATGQVHGPCEAACNRPARFRDRSHDCADQA